MNQIKIVQLFDKYGDFYQPYIPPVIDVLREKADFEIRVDAFKGDATSNVHIIPSYLKRRFNERIISITNSSPVKLKYLEHKYLKNNNDIVHIQHSYLFTKIRGFFSIPKSERPKIVITLRGSDTYIKPWLNQGWHSFYKGSGQFVDAYITMTVHQKNYMAKWGIPLDIIHVIPISYGHPFKVGEKSFDANTIQLISAFRMCWEKNIDGNLRVAKFLKDLGYSINYQIYGDGQDANQIPYLIDKYQLKDCVNYHGSIKNEHLKQKLKTSDFYLQLSQSESLGMSIIEAQTHGLPAIVSNSGGLPEVVIHDETGYCVDSYAIEEAAYHIINLWQSPKKYSEFSKAAISHSQTNFSIQKEVHRLSVLYKSLITK